MAVGGTAGFVRTQSKPSLIAGLGLGASYAFAGKADLRPPKRPVTDPMYQGYRLKNNQDYGAELALANSALLLGSAVPRIMKTGGRAPVPIGLGLLGLVSAAYYAKKVNEFRYGV